MLCVTLRQDTRVLEGAALSPQPSVVGIAASAGTHRITISLLNVKQNDAPDEVKNHSCPKSVLKKAGGREAKLRRKKKTKMEIEFWGASY